MDDSGAKDRRTRTHEERITSLRTQLTDLQERSERLTRLVDLACNRRRGQRERWRDDITRDRNTELHLAPVDLLVSRTASEPVPVVRDEVLVPRGADRVDQAVERLRELGFTDDFERDDGDLDCDDVHRFRPAPGVRRSPSLAVVLRTLRKQGLPASPHHVAALRGDMKSTDGPEYTDHPPAWNDDGVDAAQVMVIDTGLDPFAGDRADQWLHGMVDGSDVDPLDVFEGESGPVGPDGYLDGGAGHGTFVAGLVRQVAARAPVVVLRALDTRGVGTECAIARAIRRAGELFATDDNPRRLGVVNLSMGIQTSDGLPPVLVEAALRSLPPNVLVVAAAGNSPQAEPLWPAASKRALGIGALMEVDGQLVAAPWSNPGPHVDFSAIGDGVSSTYVTGRESEERDRSPEEFPWADGGQDDAYALWSGTSFSTPKIAGALARLLREHEDDDHPAAAAVRALRGGRAYLPGHGHVIPI